MSNDPGQTMVEATLFLAVLALAILMLPSIHDALKAQQDLDQAVATSAISGNTDPAVDRKGKLSAVSLLALMLPPEASYQGKRATGKYKASADARIVDGEPSSLLKLRGQLELLSKRYGAPGIPTLVLLKAKALAVLY